MKKILLIIFLPYLLFSQSQMGNEITNAQTNSGFGGNIAMSSNGNIIAITDNSYDTQAGDNYGHVQVYEYNNGSWNQIGNDIIGSEAGDGFGASLSLSSNGTILAASSYFNDNTRGYVKIFENNNGTWTQIGSDITGDNQGDAFGRTIDLSSDGSIIAIGAIYNNDVDNRSGQVKVFENNNGTWTQLGNSVNGESSSNLFGYGVKLSDDGLTFMSGANSIDTNGFDANGRIRVFEFNQTNDTWSQKGNSIDGTSDQEFLGLYTSFSGDGNTLAIGCPHYESSPQTPYTGYVKVFNYSSNTWNLIGDTFYGDVSHGWFGHTVSLSNNGETIAISAPDSTNSNDEKTGRVSVYKNENGSWVQVGNTLEGSYNGASLRHQALSGDGTKLAVRKINQDTTREVIVYNLEEALSIQTNNFEDFAFYPNPSKGKIKIQQNPSQELQNINIYSLQGELLISTKKLEINTSNLATGTYLIEFETVKQKTVKKIIIQ